MKKSIFAALTAAVTSMALPARAALSGSGTATEPYLIASAADWNAFAANINAGQNSGAFFALATDVSDVTAMVGTSHPFDGVFNGNGHTLTVAISGTGECTAPFSSIDGATISNLVVAGTVSGGNHSAGLVGTCGATGPNVIRDCTVSVAVSGTGYLGGIVGHGGQEGTLSFEGCVFSGAVSGFSAFAGGLMGWSNTMALNVTNCLSAGTFAPAGGGKYHPIACKRANQTVTAAVADAYYLNTLLTTTMGGNLVPGAEGTPVSASLVAGEWAQPITAPDGQTYYAWTPAPAGRLLARLSFDDAGNGGLNLLRAAVGQDAIVRATQTTPVAGIGNITSVTDSTILSGLAAGDGAVAVTNGQYLAVPIPAALLSTTGLPYTVVMKIRVPDTRGWRSLFNMPASNDTDEMAYLQESTRNIYLKQFNKTSGGGVGAANGFVPAEQWATLTFAFGENATDVWLDGTAVLHADGTLAGSYADCAAAGGYILVGADDNGDDELYYLSEFRIYEGAVGPSEDREPDACLETFEVGEGSIRVTGWAFDPDAPSQSIDVHVRLYTDPGCTNLYGDAHVLTANVSRPDVNQAKGITGDHGFDAEIPVPDAGTYSVKLFAIDATGNSNPQIGARMTVAVAGSTAVAETSNTVNVTKFYQSYPYSGKATIEYTVGGTLPNNPVAKIVLSTGDTSATFVQENIVAGANSHVIDFASSFGGARVLTNASFVVSIVELGGVQLWENGPYWAECNVGATKPEEYGYYFWWGDTVGYTHTGSGWISVKDGTSISFSSSGTAASTYGKDNAALLAEGWIDSTGNLVAAHDAATAHLGAPWRMPTDAEFSALINNCTTTWITTNGVSGRLVTGKGAYANRSIFLPAAGYGRDSGLYSPGSLGFYWSSTPSSGYSYYAWYLSFNSGYFDHGTGSRYYGRSVRPVRGFAE